MTQPRYYEPSGAAPPVGVITGLVLGIAAGVLLALIYTYLIVYVPLVGYVTFLFAGAFGVGIGFATAYGLRLGKVRSTGISVLAVIAVALISYAVSWAFWVGALFRQADIDIGIFYFFDKPSELVDAIKAINEIGSWSIKGATPTGGVLWFLWGLEAVIVLGAAILVGIGASLSTAFCERCNRWCTDDEDILRLDATTSSEQVTGLTHARNWEALAALGVPAHPTAFYRVQLSRCPTCENMHLLSTRLTTIKIDKEGDQSEDTTDLVTNMFVTPDEARHIRTLTPTANS